MIKKFKKMSNKYPKKIIHWIGNKEVGPSSRKFFQKRDPATGEVIAHVARGNKKDADMAVRAASGAFDEWSATPVIARANILRKATQIIQERKEDIACLLSLEAGKSYKDTLGELDASIELGFFMAGEGRRYYGRTTTSAIPNRTAETRRSPIGTALLITPANNPFAAIAWKAYPALLCGNTVVAKPSEDTPYADIVFARILKEVGMPDGVFNVMQGLGEEVGASLVKDQRIDLISFTGSVSVGKYIQKVASERLARVCLELGGKNALVVCDDADMDMAVESAILSAFSSAGQRCASGSRIIVFDKVYDEFKKRFLAGTKKLKIGVDDKDDFGPVISERQLVNMLKSVDGAIKRGVKVLTGGVRLTGAAYKSGFYMAPTILEGATPKDDISRCELFGPITILYRVENFTQALKITNDSPFGLTAAIHTKSIHRAERFKECARVGVMSVNGNTYGSEPHMPFGGLRNSGTGWREPGTEALDVYSELKTIYVRHNPDAV